MDREHDPSPDVPAARPWWRRRGALLATGAVAALALGAVGGVVAARLAAPSGADPCDAAEVTDRVLPAIVTVFASGSEGSGTGSGAILSGDGSVVTNDHVIAPAGTAGEIEVMLADGERLAATLVGRDPRTDLAVLQVEHDRSLPVVVLGRSDGVRIGQPVVALGAPLGLSSTVTAGIVSARGRVVTVPTGDGGTTVLTDVVQTDAAINPGNSGGALVDCDGRMVGVNTAIRTAADEAGVAGGGSIGIGFAVPVDTVRAVTEELRETGSVDHPSFGMATAELSPSAAARFAVPAGLVVTGLVPGGSAEAAGLAVGDLIVQIGEHTGPDEATVARIAVEAETGDEQQVTLLRSGERRVVTVTLRPDPAPPSGDPGPQEGPS